MSIRDEMLMEFQEELGVTRKILNRVPADKLAWRPHERSMSLGQLAMHIATVPAGIVRITTPDFFDVLKSNFAPPLPKSTAEIHAALEQTARSVEDALRETSDESARAPWHLMRGDHELQTTPRFKIWRSLMLTTGITIVVSSRCICDCSVLRFLRSMVPAPTSPRLHRASRRPKEKTRSVAGL